MAFILEISASDAVDREWQRLAIFQKEYRARIQRQSVEVIWYSYAF